MYKPRPPVAFAGVSDAVAVAAVDDLASPETFGLDHIQRYCAQSATARALVYRESGQLSGFALFSVVVDEGSVDNIAVRPAEQGRGVGGALLRETLATMRDLGLRRCLLEVRESNIPAQALYSRYGFREDGRRRDYYPTEQGREDAILMSRRI